MELIICLSAQGKGSLEKTNATPPQSQECKKKVFFPIFTGEPRNQRVSIPGRGLVFGIKVRSDMRYISVFMSECEYVSLYI